MGLDMYLNQKFYVKNWRHTELKDKYSITIRKGGKFTPIPTSKITYIETEVMYWRKANAIHKWFVDNVQGGNDDCGSYYVDREKLKELLAICTKIIEASKLVKSKVNNGYKIEHGIETPIMEDGETIENPKVADELLPTQSGFFFGNTDYDQYYYEDIKYTKENLEKLLAEDNGGDFEYHSSW